MQRFLISSLTMAMALLFVSSSQSQEKKATCDLKTVASQWINEHKGIKALHDALTALAKDAKISEKDLGYDSQTREVGKKKIQEIIGLKVRFDELIGEIAPHASRECAVCELKPVYEDAKNADYADVIEKDLYN